MTAGFTLAGVPIILRISVINGRVSVKSVQMKIIPLKVGFLTDQIKCTKIKRNTLKE